MQTHVDKNLENKSHSIVAKAKKEEKQKSAAFKFLDKRTEVFQKRKLQELANNSPRAKQAAQLQVMANNYSARQQLTIQKKENNTGLPDKLKTGMENLSGYSMDDVRVHYNSDKPAQLNAHAYTQGTDIHIASGQAKHLPHEAWHVVQQKQGRVKPTMQMKGETNVNNDRGLEKEADVMGEKAVQIEAKPTLKNKKILPQPFSYKTNNSVIQQAPMAGNFLTDIGIGGVATIGSNLSWMLGEQNRTTYSPVLTGAGFGTGMYAILHPPYPITGGSPASSAPSNVAWDALKNKKTKSGSTYYVRAHLLRDKFGGPAAWNNLTPLTNAGNNVGGNPISHFHAVEQPIQNALNAGRVVGYRVLPNYGGIPLLSAPTSVVNTLIGLIPGEWSRDLRNILYYENYVPTSIWTSWWYQDSWNPIPSIRVIRNWAPWDASFRYTIRGNDFSFQEWMVLGLSEILKLGLSLYWPSGSVWTGLLDRVAKFGINIPKISVLNLHTVAVWFDAIDKSYPSVSRVLGNVGSTDVSKEIHKKLPPEVSGLIPNVSEGIVLYGLIKLGKDAIT